MHPWALLLLYSLVCIAASWIGGWVPLVVHLTHRRMQFAVSFVSGIVLGIGLLHLVPHAFEALGSIDRTVLWVLAGFLVMFFLERFFPFHHHEAPDEGLDAHDHAHHDHDHHHAHGQGHTHGRPGSFSLAAVAVGLSLHGLIDGVAVAAAVMSELSHAASALAGIGTLLAVALHKPFDALTLGTLMASSGRSATLRYAVNAAYALVTPLGMLLFYALSVSTGALESNLGEILGFAAGAFLCIATSDLLPELQFHRHDRLALSAALLAGIAVAWSTVFLEASGHDHFHSDPPAQADKHEHAGEHEHGGHKDHEHPHEH